MKVYLMISADYYPDMDWIMEDTVLTKEHVVLCLTILQKRYDEWVGGVE